MFSSASLLSCSASFWWPVEQLTKRLQDGSSPTHYSTLIHFLNLCDSFLFNENKTKVPNFLYLHGFTLNSCTHTVTFSLNNVCIFLYLSLPATILVLNLLKKLPAHLFSSSFKDSDLLSLKVTSQVHNLPIYGTQLSNAYALHITCLRLLKPHWYFS